MGVGRHGVHLASMAGRTLLIVDDYPDALDLMDVTLTIAGYTTVRANNGVDAIRLARLHHPDAIVMDIALPALDGFEAAREVRGIPGLEAVPIIGYTAMCGVRLDAGTVFDRVLHKPCPPEQLLGAISDLLAAGSSPS